jgi:phosphoribosylglycinamide formyltransferase-1
MRIAFLASHGGSNVQAVLNAIKGGRLDAEAALVISNNRDSEVLRRAEREGIPWGHLSGKTHPDFADLDVAMREALQAHRIDLVVLAGYMKKLGPLTLEAYRNRILNIHPSLLPKHGGQGMYGLRVHEAVLAADDGITGVSIHLVDEEYDHGAIIAKTEVEVQPDDTPETLGARVLHAEHAFLPDVLQKIASQEISLPRRIER